MAFPGGNSMLSSMPDDNYTKLKIIVAGIAGVATLGLVLARAATARARPSVQTTDGAGQGSDEASDNAPGLARSLLLFCYNCFVKPIVKAPGRTKGTQQDALEAFYAGQAGVYDVSRTKLLKGREDMLALVAAQLKFKAAGDDGTRRKKVWVDIGGGTGFNIEAMGEFVDVPTFFSSVYLVDFSPSLCEVARKRFVRLGWANVKVVCQDAREFQLEDHESQLSGVGGESRPRTSPRSTSSYFAQKRPEHGGAGLITMSYSLSMIPDYFSVLDSLTSLLSPDGVMGVVDFYVQGQTETRFRNYTGGLTGRHVNWFGRTFWRSWFDADHVDLDSSRRDYLEYRFGTILTANFRNYLLGSIPHYIWLGCHKKPFSSTSLPHEIVERIDALATESPVLVPANLASHRDQDLVTSALTRAVDRTAPEIRSKGFDAALQNLQANLPLPSFFYQNHHWRIYYDDQLHEHKQFNNEYIYAFTWEDSREDARILQLGPDDVVLAITSAGDNILSYAMRSPARIHAIDLNPAQNHLLELKVASLAALPYEDYWKMFGEGKHPHFYRLLISRLSPHLSSRAFQYWLSNVSIFAGQRTHGLYDTGGSGRAIRIFRWVSKAFGFSGAVRQVLAAEHLDGQREAWRRKIRPSLFSRLVSNTVVSSETFLWRAMGVPRNQLAMIEKDHAASELVASGRARSTRAHAVWQYLVDTLDPVAEHTHVAADNPYYLVCMSGAYSRRCQPDYLTPEAHARLSRPGALDGLRIHTDEIDEVIARIMPGTLTVAVIMDSMDWFEDPSDTDARDGGNSTSTSVAARQIEKLNRALALSGRVLLRSSALTPWYIGVFEARGFSCKREGCRRPGRCVDRVNMYASCWVCTKVAHLPPLTPEASRHASVDLRTPTRLSLSQSGSRSGQQDSVAAVVQHDGSSWGPGTGYQQPEASGL